MDKEPTVRKWVQINRPKIPQMPQKFSAQFVCPSLKVWDFRKKSSLWVSVVRDYDHRKTTNFVFQVGVSCFSITTYVLRCLAKQTQH